MKFDLKIGSVSWISPNPNPIVLAGKAAVLSPAWVPKTYVGLIATANDPPPQQINDFAKFQKDKQFRALTYCHLLVDVDDKTK